MLKVLDGDAASDFEIWSGGDQISTAEEGEEGWGGGGLQQQQGGALPLWNCPLPQDGGDETDKWLIHA